MINRTLEMEEDKSQKSIEVEDCTKPESPLKGINDRALEWIYSTGNQTQKDMIEAEIRNRIRKWEIAKRHAEYNLDKAERFLTQLLTEAPF